MRRESFATPGYVGKHKFILMNDPLAAFLIYALERTTVYDRAMRRRCNPYTDVLRS
jgi:hypothetical protein